MTSKIPVRGGRKGQQHRAIPVGLRSYTVTPAPRRRGPAVCAMCGDPIEEAAASTGLK